MNLIRSFERRCEQMYQQRKIGGFLHLYMGQEALAEGMLSAIHSDDYVTTSYRDHGIALALGISPNVLMAELFGKVTGVSRGKGGSIHFFSKEYNLLGGHGIVGGQIPIGLGAAFRAKYLGTDQVSLIFLGDGAVNQGSFHECLNMASIWKLPAIFIIENNQYGMGTSVRRSTSVQDMTLKAQGYGMEGITVDGMNLLDCYMVVRDAVKTRRKRPSPLLVEAKTYRYRGHSISDPGTYRAKEEIENYHKVDPILQVRRLLQELDWLDDESAKALEKEVRKEVDDAVTFAEESPLPDPSERERHVYAP
ncbi:MAG: pyruvate dehydrogenase (acetyl-transferring) E1 component subunit alpha [SAR324 cluster bacterium]|nr:pyruvate dehydrogenase (acetyl-transferring) E1 component subunit alpha [SAR324 cluster bacterium]